MTFADTRQRRAFHRGRRWTFRRRLLWVLERDCIGKHSSRNHSFPSLLALERVDPRLTSLCTQSLDPQYRLQLESVYEALESGKNPKCPSEMVNPWQPGTLEPICADEAEC